MDTIDQKKLEGLEEHDEDEQSKLEKSKIELFFKKICSTILGAHLFFIFILQRYSPRWRRNLIFANYLHWPPPFQIDFKKPETCNIRGIRNFYLKSKENLELGVWQILPASSILPENTQESFDECLGDGKPIIVYAHGNSSDRGATHRLELYRILQAHDYHVIAFDYRGFGDSSPIPPDEEGVVEDAITIIMWTMQRKKASPVFLWGHSLGTGVSSRAIKELEERKVFVDGLILESPFNNLRDEIRNHPLGVILKHMIGFDYLFIQPILDSGISFRSDEYLSQCQVPILILHADNDWIVPAGLGRRLFRYLKKHRSDMKKVKYVRLRSSYGHKWICRCPSLLDLIRLFVEQKYDEIPASVN